MIGHLAVARDVLEARRGVGKRGGQQVVRLHPLERRRHLRAAALRGTASEIVAFHRHRVSNTGASSTAWTRMSRTRRRVQVAEHVGEREACCGPSDSISAVLGRRGLQLEVELAAEPLAQRERPRAVDAAAERRVQHELHAAGFVEEALEDERVLRRQRAEHGAARRGIDDLLRGLGRDTRFGDRATRSAALAHRVDAVRARAPRAQIATTRDSSSLRPALRRARTESSAARLRVRHADDAAATCRIRHELLPS